MERLNHDPDLIQIEAILRFNTQILEMIARGTPLQKSLDALVRKLEEFSDGMRGSILLLVGNRLVHGAAPNLPESYCNAINGCEIGPASGSCGTAAFRRERVVVGNIETDPLWVDYKDLALRHNLRACWSTPIVSSENKILGTFALYYSVPREPVAAEISLIDQATHLASIAIERSISHSALVESQTRLRNVVQELDLGVTLQDAHERMILCNRKAPELLGLTTEQLMGRTSLDPDWNVIHEDGSDFPRSAQPVQEAVRTLKPVRNVVMGVYRPVLQDRVWLMVDATPILDDQGNLLQVLCAFSDITPQKQAEEAIRNAESFATATLDAMSAGICVLDPRGLILAVNEKWTTSALQASTEPASVSVGVNYLDVCEVTAGEDREIAMKVAEGIRSVIHGGCAEFSMEYPCETPGGRKWFMMRATPFTEPSPSRVVVVHVDYTQRKTAEEEQKKLQTAVRIAASDWQKTFDSIESLMLILDRTAMIKRLNRAARDFIGLSYQELVGSYLYNLKNAPWSDVVKAVSDSFDQKASIPDRQVTDPVSGRTWDVSVIPLDAGEQQTLVVLRDITSLVELQASLQRSETMSMLGMLVAGVAHEVRNPLFSMSSTLDAFEARFGTNPDYERYIKIFRDEMARMTRLMHNLLEYGKPPSLDIREADFASVVQQAASQCRYVARKAKVRIATNLSKQLGLIQIDINRVVQVLENLIENAVQHSPENSVVMVEAKETEKRGEKWLVCSIRDHGQGFQPADIKKIFQPFFTRRKGGSGLGLPLAERIIQEHGGAIRAYNHAEGGAVMEFNIPLRIRKT